MKRIVESKEDLHQLIKDLGVDTIDGNKVSEDGRLYVGTKYAGQKPKLAILDQDQGGE